MSEIESQPKKLNFPSVVKVVFELAEKYFVIIFHVQFQILCNLSLSHLVVSQEMKWNRYISLIKKIILEMFTNKYKILQSKRRGKYPVIEEEMSGQDI